MGDVEKLRRQVKRDAARYELTPDEVIDLLFNAYTELARQCYGRRREDRESH